MKNLLERNNWLVSLALGALLLLVFGCENQGPVASLQAGGAASAQPRFLKTATKSFAKRFRARKTIGPYGGKMIVGDSEHGFSGILFYRGAVSQNVDISFWWESEGLLMGGVEFSPHGLQFQNTVLVRLSYKDADLTGVDENNLKVYYFNDKTGRWEPQPTRVNKDRKFVVTRLKHFSRYAIADMP